MGIPLHFLPFGSGPQREEIQDMRVCQADCDCGVCNCGCQTCQVFDARRARVFIWVSFLITLIVGSGMGLAQSVVLRQGHST